MEVSADPRAAGQARELVATCCGRWEHPEVAEPLRIVVSELVTNAVRHGQEPIVLRLVRLDQGVRVEVDDASPRHPIQQVPDMEADSGRGLSIVDAMADRWGVDADVAGKKVWAELWSH